MRPSHSIRWALILWNMLLLAVVLVTLLSVHYHVSRKTAFAEIDSNLQGSVIKVLPYLVPPEGHRGFQPQREGQPPYDGQPPFDGQPRHDGLRPLDGPPREFIPAGNNDDRSAFPAEILSALDSAEDYLNSLIEENFYLIGWNKDGTQEYVYGTAPADVQLADYALGDKEQLFASRNGSRELASLHPSGRLFVIGRPMEDVLHELRVLSGYLILIGTAILLTGFFAGRWIIDRALQPIHTISETAEEIAAGAHSRRIELAAAPEELESLASTLNSSFDHLDHALENQKRFSADASHELRTPIAVVLAQTQVGLKRERSTKEYKGILEACYRAGTRMKTMADTLLELTRIDGNESPLNLTEQPLNSIVAQTVSDASNLSDQHPISFKAPNEPVQAKVDENRIHQILMNLMRNAIQHNPDGCAIHVSLEQHTGAAVISVADEGSGIPAESLPHVFERFYRADKSRSREQGGAGLGLSIVQSLVEAHGGTIEVRNEDGAVFTIRLPLQGAA